MRKGNILSDGGILPLCLTCLRHGHLCRVEHIFDEDSVARGGVIYEDMCYRADDLAVLNDLAAAHGCGQ